ncbi:MAG: DUF2062 domain-containing protein, partial [Alphaproteobacteria bacterium]|nr:DUF2062 domain-containing protein [Alphaproteobacteria bacterium]
NIKKYIGRYNKKILVRLKQLKGTPYSIAAGFACGVAVSFTPFIGFHLIIAAVTAWIIRGNILSSAIGTLIGNPWTFPFIWVAVLSTGNYVLGNSAISDVNFLKIFEKSGEALITFNFKNFGRDVWPIIYPMMIGCIPYYVVSWFISYKLIKSAMDKLEKRRLNRLSLRSKEK